MGNAFGRFCVFCIGNARSVQVGHARATWPNLLTQDTVYQNSGTNKLKDAAANLLEVDRSGLIQTAAADAWFTRRDRVLAKRLQAIRQNDVVKSWFNSFTKEDLYDEAGAYLGNGNSESESVEALMRAKTTQCPLELVASVQAFILFFCGFHTIGAKYIANALHFQYSVDVQKLSSMPLAAISAEEDPSAAIKSFFDEGEIAGAELLLRVVVQTAKGLVARATTPGPSMAFLHKLPLFAQLVMVLINAVEAEWYQQAIPDCKMSMNIYASLLTEGAPVEQMVGDAKMVEVMEMSKGAVRGPGVVNAVTKIRRHGALVVLDDYDLSHPARDSSPDGIKTSCMTNATHSLQAFKNGGIPVDYIRKKAGAQDVEISDDNFMDYYYSFVPDTKSNIKWLIMEGSENCLKAEVKPGPPFNFNEKKATWASAFVYKTAASLAAMQPDLKMLHQGGRALDDDEEFDDDALEVLKNLGKSPQSARAGDAGTLSWMGQEAVRRAAMKIRPRVCGVVKKDSVCAQVGALV